MVEEMLLKMGEGGGNAIRVDDQNSMKGGARRLLENRSTTTIPEGKASAQGLNRRTKNVGARKFAFQNP